MNKQSFVEFENEVNEKLREAETEEMLTDLRYTSEEVLRLLKEILQKRKGW